MQPCNRSLGSWLGDCQIHPVRQGKNNNQKRQKTQARRRWKDQLAGNKKTAPSGRGVQNREPDKWAGVLQGPWIISSLLGPVCLPLGGGGGGGHFLPPSSAQMSPGNKKLPSILAAHTHCPYVRSPFSLSLYAAQSGLILPFPRLLGLQGHFTIPSLNCFFLNISEK